MFATRAMQIQAVAFLAFGLVLFLVPDWYNSLFGWEDSDVTLGRIIGGTFLGVGLIEWRVSPSPDRGTVMPFAIIPTLFVIGGVWDRAADTFAGTDGWFWFNFGVSAVFAILMWAAVARSE